MANTGKPTAAALAFAFLARREVRFLLAGAYNTAFGYFAFLLVYSVLNGVRSAAACLFISYLPSLVSAYLVQKHFVFHPAKWLSRHWVSSAPPEAYGADGGSYLEFLRFAAVNTSVLVTNLFFLPFAIRHGDMSAPVAQAVFLLLATICSYLAHRYFSFRLQPRQ